MPSPDPSCTADPASSIGTYPIILAPGSLAADNYDFSLADGTLTVNNNYQARNLNFTNGVGDGNLANPGNWQESLTPFANAFPTPADILYIGGSIASSASCVVNGNLNVYQIIINSGYTGTVTVNPGAVVNTAVSFDQHGILNLAGGTVSSNINVRLYGTVNVTTITNTINVSNQSLLALTSGNLTTEANSVINLPAQSTMTFTGTTAADMLTIKGTLNMTNATITTGSKTLNLDGGTLNCLGVLDTVVGDVGSVNLATINVGTPSAGGALTLTTGSMSIGSKIFALPSTGAVMNLFSGSVLNFPATPGVVSAFAVKGTLNMFGSAIVATPARLPQIDIEGGPGAAEGMLNALGLNVVPTSISCDGVINIGANVPGVSGGLVVTGGVDLLAIDAFRTGVLNAYNTSTLRPPPRSTCGARRFHCLSLPR